MAGGGPTPMGPAKSIHPSVGGLVREDGLLRQMFEISI